MKKILLFCFICISSSYGSTYETFLSYGFLPTGETKVVDSLLLYNNDQTVTLDSIYTKKSRASNIIKNDLNKLNDKLSDFYDNCTYSFDDNLLGYSMFMKLYGFTSDEKYVFGGSIPDCDHKWCMFKSKKLERVYKCSSMLKRSYSVALKSQVYRFYARLINDQQRAEDSCNWYLKTIDDDINHYNKNILFARVRHNKKKNIFSSPQIESVCEITRVFAVFDKSK